MGFLIFIELIALFKESLEGDGRYSLYEWEGFDELRESDLFFLLHDYDMTKLMRKSTIEVYTLSL